MMTSLYLKGVETISVSPKNYSVEIPEKIFVDIERIVARESGLDIGNYKDKCIKRRIAVRIRARGCRSAEEYIKILMGDEGEVKKLLNVLTINVTQFFRDLPTFEKIRDEVFPSIFNKKLKDGSFNLNVWSVGCSSGEEPYSIAILLREYFEKELAEADLSIIGSDIDEEMIRKGVKGIYDERSVKDMPPHLREKYLKEEGDNSYKIAEKIRKMVTLKKRNLLKDNIYMDQDVILCRNILIYFSREEQERILDRLSEGLNSDGFLILGKSETLTGNSRKHFRTVSARERIYQKTG